MKNRNAYEILTVRKKILTQYKKRTICYNVYGPPYNSIAPYGKDMVKCTNNELPMIYNGA